MKRRILYVTPHLSTGGLPQYLLKKIETFLPNFDIWCIEWQNISGDAFVVQRNKIISLLPNSFVSLPEDKWKFIDIVRSLNPEFIHFEEVPETFIDEKILSEVYEKGRNWKILVTTHSSTTNPETIKFRADKFVLVSEWSLNQFQNAYGDSVELGIWEYPIEYKHVNKAESKKKLGFEEDWKHVVNVGLFTPGKNQGELFNLARKLDHWKIKFHFVGNQANNFRDYWEPLMKNKPENCIVHGEKSNVEDYLAASDCFYFTSNLELNPISVKEALSYKLFTFIKKLETYRNTYDDKVTYITENEEVNIKNLLETLRPERTIPGWFSYSELYDRFVNESNSNDKIVEIGSWFGKSTKYLVDSVKNSGKNIQVFSIDTFQGSLNEDLHQTIVGERGGDIYQQFWSNVSDENLRVIKDTSTNASSIFRNGEIDFLMIDADHSFEGVSDDIRNFYWKVKPGGIISGDDYNVFEGTTKAVNNYFRGAQKLMPNRINWWFRVPRIQVIHMSTTPTGEKVKKSITNIRELENWNFSIKYLQSEPYSGDLDMSNYRDPRNSNVNRGHRGCYLAHTRALQEIDTLNFDYTLILEDDAFFTTGLRDFVEIVNKAIFMCEINNYRYVSFGSSNFLESKSVSDDFVEAWHQNLAHCYLIPNKWKYWWVEKIKSNPWDSADIWYNHIFHNHKEWRLATKSVWSKQVDGWSLIDNVNKKYEKGLMI